jgi:hypothetical protein
MKAAAGVLAASAVFLAGALTGFAQDEGGGSAPGLVELGEESPATTPSTPTDPTVATNAPLPTAPSVPTPTAPPPSAPPVTVDDGPEEVEHDVDEGDLDDFDDDNSGPGDGDDDDSGRGGDD